MRFIRGSWLICRDSVESALFSINSFEENGTVEENGDGHLFAVGPETYPRPENPWHNTLEPLDLGRRKLDVGSGGTSSLRPVVRQLNWGPTVRLLRRVRRRSSTQSV
jgi:hypothetical protein